jgi:hypothetical protein
MKHVRMGTLVNDSNRSMNGSSAEREADAAAATPSVDHV